VRDPGLNCVRGVGEGEDPVLRVPVECKAGFTLDDLEGFGLGEVEMEGRGLGRLAGSLCNAFLNDWRG
jgi:hypothetical protein